MILVQLARKILPFYCHLDIYMNLFLYIFYLILMFCKKKTYWNTIALLQETDLEIDQT